MKHIELFENFHNGLRSLRESNSIADANFKISYRMDPKVKELQNMLVSKGYYIGSYGENKNGVDGKYGKVTKAAHEAFQKGISPAEFNEKHKPSQTPVKPPTGKGGEVEKVTVEKEPEEAQDLGSYGKFSPGSAATDPLVVVFGGINVGGRRSGVYMYDYLSSVSERYNLFVAKDHTIDGKKAYTELKNKVGSSPSKKILYLFSGGYRPGMHVLSEYGAQEFDKIYLVDPWMGNKNVESFYVELARKNPQKVEYYYTSFGANNNSAKDEIIKSVSVKKSQAENNHMKTNQDAVSALVKYA